MNGQVDGVTLRLKSMVDSLHVTRGIGQRLLAKLSNHVKKNYKDYLLDATFGISPGSDLKMYLKLVGILIWVRVEIPLTESSAGGEIVAGLLPETEDGDDIRLLSFKFDNLGNVNNHYSPSNYAVFFINKLIEELLKKAPLIE